MVKLENLANCSRRLLNGSYRYFVMAKRPKLSMEKKNRLIWIDCEMTGLNIDVHHLVEIACLVTEGNSELTLVEEGPNIVINQPEPVLESMNDWCKSHFAKNGLLKAIKESKVSVAEAETRLVEFLFKHTAPGQCPLAGNTVSMDRVFINKYMPKLGEHFHYRTVDVSSVKELCRRWYASTFAKAPSKKQCHRAMDDIYESVQELKFYQKTIMKTPE